jgi:hypothetical protein
VVWEDFDAVSKREIQAEADGSGCGCVGGLGISSGFVAPELRHH